MDHIYLRLATFQEILLSSSGKVDWSFFSILFIYICFVYVFFSGVNYNGMVEQNNWSTLKSSKTWRWRRQNGILLLLLFVVVVVVDFIIILLFLILLLLLLLLLYCWIVVIVVVVVVFYFIVELLLLLLYCWIVVVVVTSSKSFRSTWFVEKISVFSFLLRIIISQILKFEIFFFLETLIYYYTVCKRGILNFKKEFKGV